MVNYSGSQAFVLAAQETTFNTTVSTTKDLGIIGELSPDLNNNIIPVNQIGSREAAALVAGNFDGALSIDGTLSSGAPFEMFFGQATDAETTGNYKHTFIDTSSTELVLSLLKSYSISENYDSVSDIGVLYGGCSMNSLDLSITLNEVVSISGELLAANATNSASIGTKVLNTTTPLSFSQCYLSTGVLSSEVAQNLVSDFSISLANNIDYNDIRGIGSRIAQGALPKMLEITGDFTMKFANTTEANRFLGGSSAVTTGTPAPTSIIFNAHNGVTLGSGRIELYIRLVDCQYESLGRTISSDGIVEESYSYRATSISDAYFVDQVATYF